MLQVPASARALGTGNVFVTGRGPDVLFYNPAQVGLTTGLSISAQRYGSASTLGSLSSALVVGPVGIGVGAQVLDAWSTTGGLSTGDENLAVRDGARASSRAATLGAAMSWRGMRWGAAAKYADEVLPGARAGTVALDLGVTRDVAGIAVVGVAAQNLGPGLRDGGERRRLPRRLTVGASAVAPPLGAYVDLSATAAVSVLHDGFVSPAGGVELSLTPLEGITVTGRAGARRVGRSAEQPLTLGAGLAVDRVTLDYALEGIRGSGGGHRVGLQIR